MKARLQRIHTPFGIDQYSGPYRRKGEPDNIVGDAERRLWPMFGIAKFNDFVIHLR